MTQDRYIPIDDVAGNCVMTPSEIVPKDAKIRVKDYLLQSVSTNDAKGTVTFKIVGVFLPKEKSGLN